MLSQFKDNEKENYDISGSYIFGDRDFDKNSATFGQITNPLGAGYYQNYARNVLNIQSYNLGHKGSYDAKKHFVQWGLSVEQVKIIDKLAQFEFRDSAGYSLPYTPSVLSIFNAQNSTANLSIYKYNGYVQDNIKLSKSKNDITLQTGVRFNYNNLNNQILISPRAQLSYKPFGKKILFIN